MRVSRAPANDVRPMNWGSFRTWARTIAIAAAIPAAGVVLLLAATVVGSSGQLLSESGIGAESVEMQRAAPEAGGGTKWWGSAAGALLGALIGSCVPLLLTRNARRIERRGELVAMQIEMHHAWRFMNALNNRSVLAPLYRVPVTMLEHALPKLIGEGQFTAIEVSALVQYVMRVGELNRGLQRAGEAAAANLRDLLDSEFDRNLEKVNGILRDEQWHLEGLTVYEVAELALYRLTGDAVPSDRRSAFSAYEDLGIQIRATEKPRASAAPLRSKSST
jgi:hypothetical protein